MSVIIGRIVEKNEMSTVIYSKNGLHTLPISSKHNPGDIIDNRDNIITRCYEKNFDINKIMDKKKYYEKRFSYINKMESFFLKRGFTKVLTKKLKKNLIKETNIDYIKTDFGYLTPSPEVEIKKLLSYGFDKLFELNSAYRNDYEDALHLKEFLILEWYRAMAKSEEIIEDFQNLITTLNNSNSLFYQGKNISLKNIEYITYNELFEKISINIDNFDAETIKNRFSIEGNLDRLDILDAVFAIEIEKTLGVDHITVVYNFPKERANLAKIENDFAQRYEIYIAGIELGNCYNEENDYLKLKQRIKNYDKSFFNAMSVGIPQSSGIAVGVDRLIMLLENRTEIFKSAG